MMNPCKYVGNSLRNYIFTAELGSGYGRNVCQDVETKEKFVIKILRRKNFEREIDALKAVKEKDCLHFIKLIDSGSIYDGRLFVIMELKGRNIDSLLGMLQTGPRSGFTYSTWIRTAIQTLNAIEELHYCGFIHRDVKPNNFIVESNQLKTGIIYMIDFDISTRFMDKFGAKISPTKPKKFSGTITYCSLAQHKMKPPSRMDDLESWFYTCFYLLFGVLPWGKSRDSRYVYKEKLKLRNWTELESICAIIVEIMKMIDSWDPSIPPKYNNLYELLEEEMKRLDISYNDEYDWEELDEHKRFCGYSNSKNSNY